MSSMIFRSSSAKNMLDGQMTKLSSHKSNNLQSVNKDRQTMGDEAENFAEQLMRMNTDFKIMKGVTSPQSLKSCRSNSKSRKLQQATSPYQIAPSIKNTLSHEKKSNQQTPSAQKQSVKHPVKFQDEMQAHDDNTLQQENGPADEHNSANMKTAASASAAEQQLNNSSASHQQQLLHNANLSVSLSGQQQLPQTSAFSLEKKQVTKKPIQREKKKPYKLFTTQQGAFAFDSESNLMQPFYPLQFEEYDLAFQIEREELDEKLRNNKKGDALAIAMRHKINKTLSKMQIKDKTMQGFNTLSPSIRKAANNVKQLVNSTTADAKKGINHEAPIKMYALNKVRYHHDRKFPFELLCDVQRTVLKSIDALNMKQIQSLSQPESREVHEDNNHLHSAIPGKSPSAQKHGHSQSMSHVTRDQQFKQQPPQGNELVKFLKYNESAFNNLVVYLFWIVISDWFSDNEQLSLPQEFLNEVRNALTEQYRAIYFNYLLRLRQQVMDSIIDILPFFLAEIIRALIQTKLRNHELPLQLNKTFILLISAIFRELYGFKISEISLEQQKKRYIKTFAERVKDNAKRKKFMVNTQSRAAAGSLDYHAGAFSEKFTTAQANSSSSTNVKNSIFGATINKARDPEHNMRDLSREIKSDLVNEMIQEWGKLCSHERKMAISDQINAIKDAQQPSEVIISERALQAQQEAAMQAGASKKRRQGTVVPHWKQGTLPKSIFNNANNVSAAVARKNTYFRVNSSSVIESTPREQSFIRGGFQTRPKGHGQQLNKRHMINSHSLQALGSNTFQYNNSTSTTAIAASHKHSIEVNSVTQDASHEELQPGKRSSSSSKHQQQQNAQSHHNTNTSNARSKLRPDSSQSSRGDHHHTLSTATQHLRPNNNNNASKSPFSKQRVKVSEYQPKQEDASLVALQKRIKVSQVKRECLERGKEYKPEESVPIAPMLGDKDADGGDGSKTGLGKVINFDLQHVSPIIKSQFPAQLSMNFSSMRKQTKVMIQKEPDFQRVETYKILQYELKQERERKQKELDRMAEIEAKRQQNLKHRREILKQADMLAGGIASNITSIAFKQVSRYSKKVGSVPNLPTAAANLVASASENVQRTPRRYNEEGGGSGKKKQPTAAILNSSMKTPKRQVSKQMSVIGEHLVEQHESQQQTDRDVSSARGTSNNKLQSLRQYNRAPCNVRFVDSNQKQNALKNTDNSQMMKDVTPSSSLNKLPQLLSPAEKIQMSDNKQKFFFEKPDFLRSQVKSVTAANSQTRKTEKVGNSSKTMINFKIVSEADNIDSMSAEVGDCSKKSVSASSKRGGQLEKDIYNHKLMADVRTSISRKRRHEQGGSTDSQLQQSFECGGSSQRGGSTSNQSKKLLQRTLLGLTSPEAATTGAQDANRQKNHRLKSTVSTKSANGTGNAHAQTLPPLGTSNLNNSNLKDKKLKRESSQLGGSRTRGNSVKFDEKVKVMTTEVELMAPFNETDAGQQLMRKTSKILRKAKIKQISVDGTKMQPLHSQLIDYMKGYNEKVEDEKTLVQEFLRRRLQNMLPGSLRRNKSQGSFANKQPDGHLANKHTYASMRKISNLKTRKVFDFDDYELEQKKHELQQMSIGMNRGRISRSIIELLPGSAAAAHAATEVTSPALKSPTLVTASQKQTAFASKVPVLAGPTILGESATIIENELDFKSYYPLKGAHFDHRGYETMQGLPPKPLTRQSARAGHAKNPTSSGGTGNNHVMVHTLAAAKAHGMSAGAKPSTAQDTANNTFNMHAVAVASQQEDSASKKSSVPAKQPRLAQARTELHSAKPTMQMSDYQQRGKNNMIFTAIKKHSKDIEDMFDKELDEWAVEDEDEDALAQQEQREAEEFFRRNQQLNEQEDKADIRDGIAQTKGKMMRTTGEDMAQLKMVPREHNTKIFRMLKDMRSYIIREDERKEAMRQQHKKEMEVVDSDDEKERFDEGDDVYPARPNPLEPQPKKRRAKKAAEPVADGVQTYKLSKQAQKQVRQIRSNMQEVNLFQKKTHRKNQYWD